MKHFVINLDRQPERLRRMEAVFGGLGLTFTRIQAVDRQTLAEAEVSEWGALRPGETACFLSHRECWRRVVEEDLPNAGIFEDDLHFGEGAASLLASGDWVPREAHLIKLETKFKRVRVDQSASKAIGDRTLYRLRSAHSGAGGYVVTQAGARRLLAMSSRLNQPVDRFMFNPAYPAAAALTILQLIPAICIQDLVVEDSSISVGLGSDLHEERWAKKRSVWEKVLREVKRPVWKIGKHAKSFLSGPVTRRKWTVVEFS